MQYCSLQRQTLTISYIRTTERHSRFGSATAFFLELVTTALHSCPGACWTPFDGGAHLPVSCFFLPHTVCGVLAAGILEWCAVSSSRGLRFVRTLHCDPSVLGGPAQHG